MSDTIYIHEDGQRRQANPQETSYILATQTELQNNLNSIELETHAANEAKQTALEKLAALGLTEAEIKALVG
jgi:hypothetical protein